jgi:hypothetical protein
LFENTYSSAVKFLDKIAIAAFLWIVNLLFQSPI